MRIPLGLYIHIPWCVKKCPYCDFNSHIKNNNGFCEKTYLKALLDDLVAQLPLVWGRQISCIFIGGGTPSLLSPEFYDKLLAQIRSLLPFNGDIEVSMEANPGAIECGDFKGYKQAGINRISLGVQSFDNDQLKKLGRVHDSNMAEQAIVKLNDAGVNNFNIDLMYALPGQDVDSAMFDLTKALSFNPTHLSWYQLTVEPNTVFYRKPPKLLPQNDQVFEMEQAAAQLFKENNFNKYEVSAYASDLDLRCRHNLNYWKFGDYIGIGAGACGKITDLGSGVIQRFRQHKMPVAYMGAKDKCVVKEVLTKQDIIFEYALNRFRLNDSFSLAEFSLVTGLGAGEFYDKLQVAKDLGFVDISSSSSSSSSNSNSNSKSNSGDLDNNIMVTKTARGTAFLNDLVEVFLGA